MYILISVKQTSAVLSDGLKTGILHRAAFQHVNRTNNCLSQGNNIFFDNLTSNNRNVTSGWQHKASWKDEDIEYGDRSLLKKKKNSVSDGERSAAFHWSGNAGIAHYRPAFGFSLVDLNQKNAVSKAWLPFMLLYLLNVLSVELSLGVVQSG